MKLPPPSRRPVKAEYSAGGIVFRRSARGIEIAFLLDPFHKWSFAKGHIERGEKIAQAAAREVREEMGVRRLRVVASLGRIDWWFKERRGSAHSPKGTMVHKFSHYFLMEVPPGTRLFPQKSELISEARWVPAWEAWRISGYKDVRPVLKRALDIIQKLG